MAKGHTFESSGVSLTSATKGKRPNIVDLSVAWSRAGAWDVPLLETALPRPDPGSAPAPRSLAARSRLPHAQEHAMSSSSHSRVLHKIATRRQKSARLTDGEPRLGSRRAAFPTQHPTSGASILGKRVLTPREIEVLRLVAHGETDRRIAEKLFVSRRTVSCHVSNILDKLNVESRRKAVLTAMRIGLL